MPKKKELAVYIHIPFCERKCNYCDFTSFDDRPGQMQHYVDALCGEIRGYRERLKDHVVGTIYIGGGTPSLLSNAQMSQIITCLRENYDVRKITDRKFEFTIECNPNSVTAGKLEHWFWNLQANRISLGLQSLNDDVLNVLGRAHDGKRARYALRLIEKAGFGNISIDLIYAVPYKNLTFRRDMLEEVATLICRHPITHVSLYELTLEQHTPLWVQCQQQQLVQYTADESIIEQSSAANVLEYYGFKRYEVSNFAVRGFECRHNNTYWHPEAEYLGLGLGASGLLDNTRYQNTEDLDLYLLKPDKVSHKHERSEQDLQIERVMLGLRTRRGVPIKHLSDKGREIAELLSYGMIRVTSTHVHATKAGFMVLNKVIDTLT